MRGKRVAPLLICTVGMLLLILDARSALMAASEGISACISAVIPSLFPFFVLSAIINSALLGVRIPLLRPLSKLCRIPEGTESLMLLGLIGGYPVGAAGIRNAYDRGALNKTDAERMLSFCNNAGPSFIFGILSLKLGNIGLCFALWGIHILTAVIVGALMPGQSAHRGRISSLPPISLTQAMQIGIRNIANVCGWVILFRIVIGFFERWVLWALPSWTSILLVGFAELTNGCLALGRIEALSLRFLFASVFLAFGGICVSMQTASVSGRLSLRKYYIGKLLQTGISLILSGIFVILLSV